MTSRLNRNVSGAAAALITTAGLLAGPAGVLQAESTQAARLAQAEVTVDSIDRRTRSVVVRYDDLDLTRAEGQRALYHRLDAAATRACGWYDMRSAFERRTWRECRAAALAGAVASVDDPEFSAWAASADAGRDPVEPRIATATGR